MASNNVDDEKPNLRPTKRITASGKTIFFHSNFHQPPNTSYVHARLEKNDQSDLFDTQQPHVIYSLNKKQRWERFNDFHEQIEDQSSLSSDEDSDTQSDSEQRRKKNKPHRTKPQKTTQKREDNDADVEDNDKTKEITTYVTEVPSSQHKQFYSIRKYHRGSANKKITSRALGTRSTQTKERFDVAEQLEDEEENLSSDEDDFITSFYTSSTPNTLQLNDFIPVASVDAKDEISSKSKQSDTIPKSSSKPSPIYLNDENSLKPVNRFYRQISKEEKLYNRDMTTYLKMVNKQQETGKKIEPKEKSRHHLMSLSFRTIHLHQTDLTIEHLSKTYGKNFIHAQCYPTKYLICLTDRLKSYPWSNKFDLFSIYSTLNCYLIIILNSAENPCQGQVSLNMDLYSDTIEIETLSQSNETVYKLDELINETIEFIGNLSFDLFKPIDSEIAQRKYFKTKIDNELSESEFINKQIQQIQLLDKKDLQNEELNINTNIFQPEICTNCCSDMNQLTPMTALKSCNHWLCNACWKQYLENSIKSVKVILCPEWNCCSMIDVGTILSLVNVRCMSIYERNLEKCLVNLSRSHIKCPVKSCSNIIQINSSTIDNIRCRCGHQFCIDCKQEPHFPATCTSYQAYIDEMHKNGDSISELNTKTIVRGRNCISCDHFIEKNGGCNHMTCRCGAQFCWLCTAHWKDHYSTTGAFECPRKQISIQTKLLKKERNLSRRLYEHAIYHRFERAFTNQAKQNENVKRLMGTIPLDKGTMFNSSLIQSEIDKRETLLRHGYEMVKYINYLHRVCEFIAVAADGYANNPIEFSNSLYPLETLIFNLSQVLEGGRGYKAIEQLNELHKTAEKLLERLRQAVIRRRINPTGYATS